MWAVWLAACTGEPAAPVDTGWDRGENPHALDDVLRWNHVQVEGTHNSYHQQPPALIDPSMGYSQPSLTEQLDTLGVRQLELDVHLGQDGTWQVFHIPGIDDLSSCPLLADCLTEIKAWSDANGWHLPLLVWLEPKDDVDAAVVDLVAIGAQLDTLDDAILDVWPRSRLFTPDDLRGTHASLPEALAADGWPLLGELRGRVVFAVLDSDAHRDTYLQGSDVLAGRVMFVDTTDRAEPWAALVKDGSPTEITAWGTDGFIITTNGSSATDSDEEAAAIDQERRDAGVHQLATDLPGPSDDRDYTLDLAPRCNPVTAPSACDDAEIEKL